MIAEQLIAAPTSADTIIARALNVTDKTVAAVRRDMEARSEIPTVTERMRSDGKTCRTKPTARAVFAKNQRETETALATLSNTCLDAMPNNLIDVRLLKRAAREARSAARAKDMETTSTGTVETTSTGTVDIRLGDFREAFHDIAPGTADRIFTDPPFNGGPLTLWSDLKEFASRVLKPGGVLVTITGQTYLPDVIARLSAHLRYVWTIAQIGSARESSNYNLHVFGNWKPVLVYAKSPYQPGKWYSDLLRGSGQEKDQHPWQQALNEACSLIEIFTNPSDIVLDPFCGSGTTAAASVLLGRRCICVDVDTESVATTRERVRQVLQHQE